MPLWKKIFSFIAVFSVFFLLAKYSSAQTPAVNFDIQEQGRPRVVNCGMTVDEFMALTPDDSFVDAFDYLDALQPNDPRWNCIACDATAVSTSLGNLPESSNFWKCNASDDASLIRCGSNRWQELVGFWEAKKQRVGFTPDNCPVNVNAQAYVGDFLNDTWEAKLKAYNITDSNLVDPPSNQPSTDSDAVKQLTQEWNCGALGKVCCDEDGDPPSVTEKPINSSWIDPVWDFIKPVFTPIDTIQKNQLKDLRESAGNPLCFDDSVPSTSVESAQNLDQCLCIPLIETEDSNPNDAVNDGNAQCKLIDDQDERITCYEEKDKPANALKIKCSLLTNEDERETCRTCADDAGIWTAAGCIYTDYAKFIQSTVFGWGLGIAGFAAFMCIIYAAFQLQISANNPEKIKEAQELITSCIVGLIVIIFSVFILRVIGVDILQIPGFGV